MKMNIKRNRRPVKASNNSVKGKHKIMAGFDMSKRPEEWLEAITESIINDYDADMDIMDAFSDAADRYVMYYSEQIEIVWAFNMFDWSGADYEITNLGTLAYYALEQSFMNDGYYEQVEEARANGGAIEESTRIKGKRPVKASNNSHGYLYILQHGLGPGVLPKSVGVLKSLEMDDWGYPYATAVWLDRFLTTKELTNYDITPETQLRTKYGSDVIDEIEDMRYSALGMDYSDGVMSDDFRTL